MVTPALAVAGLTGALAALLADVLLQGALAAVRIDASSWGWLPATLFDRGRWVVVAVLLWLASRRASAGAADRPAGMTALVPLASAFELVGRGMVSLPLLWLSATLLMRAIRLTLDGGWPYEGRIFLTADFYGSLIVGYAPWAMGGLVLIALSRHVRLTDGSSATSG